MGSSICVRYPPHPMERTRMNLSTAPTRIQPWPAGGPTLCIVLGALLWVSGCSSESGPAGFPTVNGDPVTAVQVLGPEEPPSGLGIALDRCVNLLREVPGLQVRRLSLGDTAASSGTLTLALGRGEATRAIIPDGELEAMEPGGIILRRGTVNGVPILAGAGADGLGDTYAVYGLLERLGFGFFHPEDTYVPERLTLPETLDEAHNPGYRWRGTSVHTMHPVEYMDSLLVPSERHLQEVERYVDWLVANRQNYFQWVLQDTVPLEEWIPHAARIIGLAHARGLRVGIDTPLEFIQQNAFALAPDPSAPFQPQIEENLARILLRAPFDVINVELGAAEAIPVDDVRTLEMLNFTAEHLDTVYGVELIAKVHCTSDQTAPNFGNINFNFLPGIADPRVGVMPHTVQFYDLYRTAPTYGQENFHGIRAFLLEEIGERTVLYYPESAYWVSFDVDIPLFLPHYVFSRWNDLNRLAASGMDGQVLFSSGLEWGYWLNEWTALAAAWEPETPWQELLGRFARIFGQAADPMHRLLADLVEEQGRDLLEGGLIAYLIGWDSADDFGELLAGINFQPRRVLFPEILAMNAEELAAFQASDLARLGVLEETYDAFTQRVEALEPLVPERARRWYREVKRGIQVTSLRVQHVRRLNEGTVLRRKHRLGLDPEGEDRAMAVFREAIDVRRAAEGIVGEQEPDYRWPVERIARPRENPTSYEYGYLYTASDGYYWRREEIQAVREDDCFCMGNLNYMIANLFGEGHPLDLLVRSLPPLPGHCLNTCIHPADRIEEIGDLF